MSKIATCFILLAIASPQMRQFIWVCRAMVAFILGYCVACSIATVFQCGTHFDSNWIHSHDQASILQAVEYYLVLQSIFLTVIQTYCFSKPPFWYTHAALNIFSSIVMAVLPWWLFSAVTYKRKYIIGTMLSGLAFGYVFDSEETGFDT